MMKEIIFLLQYCNYEFNNFLLYFFLFYDERNIFVTVLQLKV